jgi:DNA-binding SARP family transcriptional activator
VNTNPHYAESMNRSSVPQIRVNLLDGFQLERDYVLISIPPSSERMIAFLALRNGRIRAEVAGTLWPDVYEERALASLRTTLWRIGRICPGTVVTVGGLVSLAQRVNVDVRDYVDVAKQIVEGEVEPSSAFRTADLMRGDLLPGWYEDWVITERERLRQLGLHALESLAVQLAQQGRHAAALEAALLAVAAEPLRESAHRVAVEVHLAEGNLAEAVHQYEACRRLLRAELGVSPTLDFAERMRGAHGSQR